MESPAMGGDDSALQILSFVLYLAFDYYLYLGIWYFAPVGVILILWVRADIISGTSSP